MSKPFPAFDGFRYSAAVPFEDVVTRRDPSPVIRVRDTYHVWYSRSTVDHTGYYASVYHATSPDGVVWIEKEEAIAKGGRGDWDENGVFTPTILVAGNLYYLFYTAVPTPFRQDPINPTPTAIGVTVADSPDGPWDKFGRNPVLEPGPEGAFDCLRVDDSCLIKRDGKYWLYYKGRGRHYTPMGLATAEHPTGPYVKHSENPLIESGHEVCVWPHGEGVAAIVSGYGPNGNNVRYASDGIHFTVMAHIQTPHAPGPFRQDHFRDGVGPGIQWGLCVGEHRNWPFLQRFGCNLQAEATAEPTASANAAKSRG